MSRDQTSDTQRRDTSAPAVDAPVETAPAGTQFVSTGPIPPVETAAGKPAPSASDRAFGQGVQALEAMLGKGKPKPEDVATLIDAHRDEHDQMLAVVQQQLGEGFADTVRADLHKLRASIANKEVVAGDPADPKSGYFDASAQLGGAKWKTAGGGFTGTANKDGLDTSVILDPKDTLHANIKSNKSGTVDWLRDGKTEGELYGHYNSSKDEELGLRRTQDVAGGSLTEGIHHQVGGGSTTDEAYADYKRGNLDAHADAGLKDGKAAGSLTATDKLKHDSLSGSISHDGKGTNADLKDTHDFGGGTTANAEVADKNGKWSETASVDHKTKHDDLAANVTHDAKGLTGNVTDKHDFGGGTTTSGQLSVQDGKLAETASVEHKTKHDDLTANVTHDAKGVSGNVTDKHDFGNGITTTGSVTDKDGQWSENASVAHKTKTDDLKASVAHDSKGTTVDASDQHDWGNGLSTNAVLHHDNASTTGSLAGTYKTKHDTFDASVTRDKADTKLHADGTEQLTPALSLTQKLDETIPDQGKPQTTFDLGEKYRTGKVIEGVDVEGGRGTQNYLKGTGSIDAQLAPNLYGSAWGSYAYQEGHQNTAQVGGSLTFTQNEKEALTLAGVIDQHGRLETRLQLDVFKDKINSIDALDQHKKDAMVSLFVSYSTDTGARTLDDRFGAPDYETNRGNEVTAGIKIRF